MKRFFFSIIVLLSSVTGIFASDNRYFINDFKDNWFVGVAGGAQCLIGRPNNEDISIKEKISPTISGYVGKWLQPNFGLRLTYNGFNFKNYYAEKKPYFALHGDLMVNLHNLLGGYEQSRFWNIAPYLGAGWLRNCDTRKNNGFTIVGGLYNVFNINGAFGVTLDLSCILGNQEFDMTFGGEQGLDKLLVANVGVVYRFKKRNWDSGYSMEKLINFDIMGNDGAALLGTGDVYDGVDSTEMKLSALNGNWGDNEELLKSLLAEKQDRYDKLSDELDRRSKDIEKIRMVLEKTEKMPSDQTIFFALSSHRVSKKYLLVLQPMVDYAKMYHKKIKIVGYADNATGTTEFNLKLSRARAEEVASEVVKMGLDPDNLIISGEGGANVGVQDYNRRVIVSVVDIE